MITGTALWYASRATGVVSLVLFSVVAILGIMVNRQGRLPGLPRFAVTGLHRSLSLLTVAFLGIHITTAIADGYVHIPWLSTIVPFTSGYERFWKGRVERLRDHLRRTPVRRPKLTNKEISYTVQGYSSERTWPRGPSGEPQSVPSLAACRHNILCPVRSDEYP